MTQRWVEGPPEGEALVIFDTTAPLAEGETPPCSVLIEGGFTYDPATCDVQSVPLTPQRADIAVTAVTSDGVWLDVDTDTPEALSDLRRPRICGSSVQVGRAIVFGGDGVPPQTRIRRFV